MVFIVPPCWLSLKQIHLENDVANWLPKNDEKAIALDWYLSHFPSETTLFMTWEGSSVNDPRIALIERQLEGVVDEQGIRREGSQFVKSVSTPEEGMRRILDRKVDQTEAIRRMTGLLIGRGPLKVKLSKTGISQKRQLINDLVVQAKEKLGVDLKILDPFVPPEPNFTDEQYALLNQILEDNKTAADEAGEEYEEIYLEIPEHDFQVTPLGNTWLTQLGLDMTEVARQRRQFAPRCLDWSERRPHIAGALGAALLNTLEKRKLIRRLPDTREVTVTRRGARWLADELDCLIEAYE